LNPNQAFYSITFSAHIANKITLWAYDTDTLGKKGSRFVEMKVTILNNVYFNIDFYYLECF